MKSSREWCEGQLTVKTNEIIKIDDMQRNERREIIVKQAENNVYNKDKNRNRQNEINK